MTCILPEEYDRSPCDAADDTITGHTRDARCLVGDRPLPTRVSVAGVAEHEDAVVGCEHVL
jgi:hypothetical protein